MATSLNRAGETDNIDPSRDQLKQCPKRTCPSTSQRQKKMIGYQEIPNKRCTRQHAAQQCPDNSTDETVHKKQDELETCRKQVIALCKQHVIKMFLAAAKSKDLRVQCGATKIQVPNFESIGMSWKEDCSLRNAEKVWWVLYGQFDNNVSWITNLENVVLDTCAFQYKNEEGFTKLMKNQARKTSNIAKIIMYCRSELRKNIKRRGLREHGNDLEASNTARGTKRKKGEFQERFIVCKRLKNKKTSKVQGVTETPKRKTRKTNRKEPSTKVSAIHDKMESSSSEDECVNIELPLLSSDEEGGMEEDTVTAELMSPTDIMETPPEIRKDRSNIKTGDDWKIHIEQAREMQKMEDEVTRMRMEKNRKEAIKTRVKKTGKTSMTKKESKGNKTKKGNQNNTKRKKKMNCKNNREQYDEEGEEDMIESSDNELSVGFENFVGYRPEKKELRVQWTDGTTSWSLEKDCRQDWGHKVSIYIKQWREDNEEKHKKMTRRQTNAKLVENEHDKLTCEKNHDNYVTEINYQEEGDGKYCNFDLKNTECRDCKSKIVGKGKTVKNKFWRVTRKQPVWTCVNRKGLIKCRVVVCNECFLKKNYKK